ncbi:MAG TPA: hypothetical protein HPP83_02020 [Candidatus Hydrogenedentes bacterium]|nr:hypothetical protein [Candidatus Hydrogenedentota bacterium]
MEETVRSIRDFGIAPANSGAKNKRLLQEGIEWAAANGSALFISPTDEPYPVEGGLQVRRNVSLIGVHGPVGRGTTHPRKQQPVGSVFRIDDADRVFLTVEAATQVRGVQFWYPEQTLDAPEDIIKYPATIQGSRTTSPQGVTLSCLTFYGEYVAMDFTASADNICELILFEHCYGYPLSGRFICLDYCYDIPRILHCHVNPANRRFIDGQYSPSVVDHVVAQKTFSYWVDHTDNAQFMDLFTFGAYGGAYLGADTYGQLTNFNFDCVTVGIHKQGSGSLNRNWQIAQGSIIANTGDRLEDIHPIIVEGQGHTAVSNVEAFSGKNPALTAFGKSQDFLIIRGDQRVTVSLSNCRMRDYAASDPISNLNPNAVIQANGCIDAREAPFSRVIVPEGVRSNAPVGNSAKDSQRSNSGG